MNFMTRMIALGALALVVQVSPAAAMGTGDGGQFDAIAGGNFGGNKGGTAGPVMIENKDAGGKVVSVTLVEVKEDGTVVKTEKAVRGGGSVSTSLDVNGVTTVVVKDVVRSVKVVTVTDANGTVVSRETSDLHTNRDTGVIAPGVDLVRMGGTR